MATKDLPDVAYLRECFNYDPETGVLMWKHRPRNHFISNRGYGIWNAQHSGGTVTNTIPAGYVRAAINNRRFYVHRIVWMLQTGAWPSAEIDHINCDKADNRWCNLREANRQQNCWNVMKYKGQLPMGVKPDNRYKQKFHARIYQGGKEYYLGMFDTIEAAAEARRAYATSHRGEFFNE